MAGLVATMQNVDALAFALLGVAIAIAWLRKRDRSTGFLALAIVLLSSVSLLGSLPSLIHVTVPLLPIVNLVAFAGSGYALLRYRAALIPLSPIWHSIVVAALAITTAILVVSTLAGAPAAVQLWAAVVLVAAWAVVVLESIVRFWLVARGLSAVQAWRLRSLSLAFAGIVVVLLIALAMAGARASKIPDGLQLAIQLAVLAVVPLLYVSFAPPAWLRREWRSAEEEGLRAYMEGLLVDQSVARWHEGALTWAARITGAGSAVMFDSSGAVTAVAGIERPQLDVLRRRLSSLPNGLSRSDLGLGMTTIAIVPIAGPAHGRLALLAGPFTAAFGADELNRVQQFMTAVTAGLDRKRLVSELQAANLRLQEASAHKSVFLANMSHELRTPLNAIIGFSELMLDARESQFDGDTQKRFLSQVHTSGKHLLGLINDILDLSKVEAGQMELRLQSVEIGPVVTSVLDTIEPLAVQKGIRIEAEVKGSGEVQADAGKLRQMLLNLVSNAIKFTPDRGTISVSWKRSDEAVEISIADSGIGISKEDQGKIFREFHQLDTGPGRREQGTGLGLALTRRFAVLHGGDVTVSSEPGKGSVFTLHLPAHVSAAAISPAVAPVTPNEPVDESRPLVLVIEDDAGAAELLTRQLALGGFRTSVARTGTEAITSARSLRPAAITLDILLPELDGWEVMSRLKAEPETSEIPVVVVSVIDNPDLGMALGALDYFVKPVDSRQLVARLKRFKLKGSKDEPATVLVVDDEAANRQWLTRILEPAGFNVELATGGREAIELAKARPPDLVLLDLMMPEVTGFDVVEALRSDQRTQDTPIMILTARHLTEEDKRHLNGHVSTILSRGSVGASDLIGLLHQVVEQPGAATGS